MSRLGRLHVSPAEPVFGVALCGLLALVAGTGGLVAGLIIVLAAGVTVRLRDGVRTAHVLVACLVAAMAAVLFLAPGYRLHQMSDAFAIALVVLSLNLLTGYTGQISIGHSAFVGIGAYTAALAVSRWSLPFPGAIVLAGAASGCVGLIIGLPALRLSGPYLAIATVALAVIFPEAVKLDALAGSTGGVNGLALLDTDLGSPIDWTWLNLDRWHFLVVAVLLLAGVWLVRNLLRYGAGRSLQAVRDSEVAAMAMGISTHRTKLGAFFISAAMAGVAGSMLFMIDDRFVSPESFVFLVSVNYLVALVVGGLNSILGPVIGALFLVYVYQDGLESVADQTQSGSNLWPFIGGLVVGLIVLNRSARVANVYRACVRRLGPGRGIAAFAALRVVGAVVVGVVVAAVFRAAADSFLNVSFLNDAISGIVLILVMLLAPDGIAGMLSQLRETTWRDLGRRWAMPPGVRHEHEVTAPAPGGAPVVMAP